MHQWRETNLRTTKRNQKAKIIKLIFKNGGLVIE